MTDVSSCVIIVNNKQLTNNVMSKNNLYAPCKSDSSRVIVHVIEFVQNYVHAIFVLSLLNTVGLYTAPY